MEKILKKYCFASPSEDREACVKALGEVFEVYRASTSQRIGWLEQQVSEYEGSLQTAKEAAEEAERELEILVLDREWEDAVKQYWRICEGVKIV